MLGSAHMWGPILWRRVNGAIQPVIATLQTLFNDGTEALPGAAFVQEPSSGLRRVSAGLLSLVVLANDVIRASFAAGAPATVLVDVGTLADTQNAQADLRLNSANGTTARAGGLRGFANGVVRLIGESGLQFAYGAHPGNTVALEINGSSQVAAQAAGTAALPPLVPAANDVDTGSFQPSGYGNYQARTFGALEGIRETSATVTTADATVTTLLSIAIPDESIVQIRAYITARDQAATSANWASYGKVLTVRREGGGVATIVGAVQDIFPDMETAAAWNATIDVDGGNNARVRVTGAAATSIRWECHVEMKVST